MIRVFLYLRGQQGKLVWESNWCSLEWNLQLLGRNLSSYMRWGAVLNQLAENLELSLKLFCFCCSMKFRVSPAYIETAFAEVYFNTFSGNWGDSWVDFWALCWNTCPFFFFVCVLLCPLLWIHISDVHLNSIDHKGTHWQTYNELWSEGIACESGFPLLTTIATKTLKWNSQVTVSRDSGARRGATRERGSRGK